MKRELPLAQAHRLLAGRPACLLTTRYKGQVNVMAISWVCPVSMEPPLLVMAIHPSCYTHDMLTRSQQCVLNVPGRPLAEQVARCGSLSGANVDKVATLGFTLESGRRVEVPWIESCLAHLELGIVDQLMPGDHTVFVGEILAAWVQAEAFDQVWEAPPHIEELQPLLHLGGDQYATIGARISLPKGESAAGS